MKREPESKDDVFDLLERNRGWLSRLVVDCVSSESPSTPNPVPAFLAVRSIRRSGQPSPRLLPEKKRADVF
jgi:hypothetical protein